MNLSCIHSLLVGRINSGVLIIDSSYRLIYFNHFMQSHPKLQNDNVLGQDLFELFSELPVRWFKRKIQSVFSLNTPAFSSWEQRQYLFKMRHTRPVTTNSRYMAQNVAMLPVKSDEHSHEVSHVCIVIEDATDVYFYQQRLNLTLAELEQSNRTDGLTQIANRRYWEERFDVEFIAALRYQKPLSLILFDLDRFKKVNDVYGHQAGDRVLIDAAQLIQSMLRKSDIFGRYGGEEFGIILPNTSLEGAFDLAERIRAAFESLDIVHRSKQIKATLSMGVVSYHSGISNYEDMLTRADIALYESKRNGRNKVTIYKETATDICNS